MVLDDGPFLYFDRAGDGVGIVRWDYNSEPKTTTINYGGTMRLGAATADGRFIILALDNGSLQVFDSASGEKKKPFADHKRMVYEVAIAPDAKTVLSFSKGESDSDPDNGFSWDLHTAEQKLSYNVPGRHKVEAFDPDSRFAILSSPNYGPKGVQLHAGDALGVLGFEGHTSRVHDVAVEAKGRYVVTAGEDCTVRLWLSGGGCHWRRRRLTLLHCVLSLR